MRVLVSAGEASGDMYAAGVVSWLARLYPSANFFGCAGPRLQAGGVTPIIDSSQLAVVGLAEVLLHLPRIYHRYRKLVRFLEREPPDFALLTDSPDFHLRLARHLKRLNVPVYYLVAPQVWAWRQSRVNLIRDVVHHLFCLFPFEEAWFRECGVHATYIGHPLAAMVRPNFTRDEFFHRHNLPRDRPMLVLLPGSRIGEASRHLPILLDAVSVLRRRFAFSTLLATPKGFHSRGAFRNFREPIEARSIQVLENETWDSIAHADLALAASGTVTIEAAVLGTPMITFYKVNPLSWWAGRRLVKVPFLSMVNLIAGRQIVPELIQNDMTAPAIASHAAELLASNERAAAMRKDLAAVRAALSTAGDPLRRAAELIAESYRRKFAAPPPTWALSTGDNR